MDAKTDDKGPLKCPVAHGTGGTQNRDWWPNQLRVDLLSQHSSKSDPLGQSFNYREEFKKLDYEALKNDLRKLMTDSQDWWPGRLRQLRACSSSAWPGTAPAPTAWAMGAAAAVAASSVLLRSTAGRTTSASTRSRRLLWPIKQKYGQQISWADLLILTGNVALETMGFRTFGLRAPAERTPGNRIRTSTGAGDHLARPPAAIPTAVTR